MAKLPGINYSRTGVASMGREDVSAPARLYAAKSGVKSSLLKGTLQIAKQVKTANESADAINISSSMSEDMAELNTRIKHTKSYTPQELNKLGVEYDDKLDRDIIPASEVSETIYKQMAGQIKKDAMSRASGNKAAAAVNRIYSSLYKQGIDDAVMHSIAHAQAEVRIKTNVGFENAVVNGDAEGAKAIADTALANGTWGEKEYVAHVKPMRNRVASNLYLKQLDIVDNAKDIEGISDKIIVDADLSFESRKSLYSSAQSKLKIVNKAIEKRVADAKVEDSSVELTNLSTGIIGSNAALDWDDVYNYSAKMTPSDRRALIAINRSVEKGAASISDDSTLRQLTADVKTLSFPVEGTTVAQRRGGVSARLVKALEGGSITPSDFSTLMDGINKAQNFAYANPDHKFTEEEIWVTLTGGSKDIISQLFGGGEAKLNVVDATHALHSAAMREGPSFDAGLWWKSNQEKYLVKAIKSNYENLQKDRNIGLVVQGNDGFVDMTETTKVLNRMVKDGSMDQNEMNRILTDTEKRDKMDRQWKKRLESRKVER